MSARIGASQSQLSKTQTILKRGKDALRERNYEVAYNVRLSVARAFALPPGAAPSACAQALTVA